MAHILEVEGSGMLVESPEGGYLGGFPELQTTEEVEEAISRTLAKAAIVLAKLKGATE